MYCIFLKSIILTIAKYVQLLYISIWTFSKSGPY